MKTIHASQLKKGDMCFFSDEKKPVKVVKVERGHSSPWVITFKDGGIWCVEHLTEIVVL